FHGSVLGEYLYSTCVFGSRTHGSRHPSNVDGSTIADGSGSEEMLFSKIKVLENPGMPDWSNHPSAKPTAIAAASATTVGSAATTLWNRVRWSFAALRIVLCEIEMPKLILSGVGSALPGVLPLATLLASN